MRPTSLVMLIVVLALTSIVQSTPINKANFKIFKDKELYTNPYSEDRVIPPIDNHLGCLYNLGMSNAELMRIGYNISDLLSLGVRQSDLLGSLYQGGRNFHIDAGQAHY